MIKSEDVRAMPCDKGELLGGVEEPRHSEAAWLACATSHAIVARRSHPTLGVPAEVFELLTRRAQYITRNMTSKALFVRATRPTVLCACLQTKICSYMYHENLDFYTWGAHDRQKVSNVSKPKNATLTKHKANPACRRRNNTCFLCAEWYLVYN